MLIRRAQSKDAEAIGLTRVAAWKAAYGPFMPPTFLAALNASTNLDNLRTALDADPVSFLMNVVEINDDIVAFSMLGRPRYPAQESMTELWALNVHPKHWRKGIGQQLVLQALTDAKSNGYSEVELWCIDGNVAACRLYEACGFKADGRSRISSELTGHPLHEIAYTVKL